MRLSVARSVLAKAAFSIALLALPAITLWNAAHSGDYKKFIKFGPSLFGVEVQAPIVWSFEAMRSGTFQKAVTEFFGRAMPTRPTLVRFNNELRFRVFDVLASVGPQTMRTSGNQLFDKAYIEEYCGRTENAAIALAAGMAPRILDIQNEYLKRGAAFLHVITPSNFGGGWNRRPSAHLLPASATTSLPSLKSASL